MVGAVLPVVLVEGFRLFALGSGGSDFLPDGVRSAVPVGIPMGVHTVVPFF